MPQVLLVEDDAAIRVALTRSLHDQGHVVRTAVSGITALSDVVEQKPDVVLLDLGLPDIDGADVLSMLRAVSDVPVIVAVLRRTDRVDGNSGEGPIILGGLHIDTRSREVTVDGTPVELARKEFDLLLALARRAGEVVTKRDLLAEVWQLAWGGSDRTVDVHLSWLRRKLGESAKQPRYLHSVRGVGVRLVAPES
jgi:DNA-binding response OmpR family regulator